MYKNLLFDLGGVIYDIEFPRMMAAFEAFERDINALHLFSKTAQHDLVSLYEVGAISTEAFIQRLRETFGLKATDTQIKDAWNALLIGVIEGRLAQLTHLKGKYNLALLSNTNMMHYEYIFAECEPIYAQFQRCFFSPLIQMRKPDLACFEFVLREMGWKVEETLFIEDSPPNIEAARSMGLEVFVINNPSDFEAFFEQYK
jgi:putative hydrolase of the HAD superfamily